MTYDEAIKQLDEIIKQLESDDNISMDDYKQKAKEAKKLIDFCKNQLLKVEEELSEAVN